MPDILAGGDSVTGHATGVETIVAGKLASLEERGGPLPPPRYLGTSALTATR